MAAPAPHRLASYLPPVLVRRIAADPIPPVSPWVEHRALVTFFADISGFTALAERLGAKSAAGVEELTELLNRTFGELIRGIHLRGGEILRFAGDATLALWFPGEGEGLEEAVLRAAECGLDAQRQFAERSTELGGLRLRVGVGAGEALLAALGGIEKRWEFVVLGSPVDEMGEAEREARPGDVVLTSFAGNLVAGRCAAEVLPSGARRIESILGPPAPIAATSRVSLVEEGEALRAFLPRAVFARLDAGQMDWLAEFRRVTVLFARPRAGTTLEELQRTTLALQSAVYRFGGSVNQYLADDKGLVLLAAWGVPGSTHEDDASRALEAALAARAALAAEAIPVAIGVSTGRVFCGTRGNEDRREYALIGDVVNLAARLMQLAGDDVLCESRTRDAATKRLDFTELPPRSVKGREAPVAVHRPVARTVVTATVDAGAIVGRQAERATIRRRLEALSRDGVGGVLVLEGEPGIGKSRLLRELLRQCDDLGLRAVGAAASAIERNSPYHAVGGLLSSALDLPASATADERAARVTERLREDPELLSRAALLDPVLGLDLAEPGSLARMSGSARAEATRELALRLFRGTFGDAPAVLALEDAHWLDSASWAVALAVRQRLPHVLLVLATRPADDTLSLEARQLLGASDAVVVRLEGLGRAEAVELACQRLGVAALPQAAVDLILEKSGGHPLYVEELARTLRELGALVFEEGRCRLAPGAGDLRSLSLPQTVEGIVTTRIDRLAPPAALTIKVASVVGRSFRAETVREVSPVETSVAEIRDQLSTLAEAELAELEAPEPDLAYAFKHAITQDVAYSLLVFAQRRELHRRVAEWYEVATPDRRSILPLLAHHWSQTDLDEKAFSSLEEAGEQALAGGAHREAAAHLARALERAADPAKAGAIGRGRLARWHRELSDAYFGMGDLPKTFAAARETLEYLGIRIPATPAGWRMKLATNALASLVHLALPGRFVPAAEEERVALAQGALAAQRLAERHYYAYEALPMIAASLLAANLAARASGARVARSFGMLGFVVGLMGLDRLGLAFFRRARHTAESTDDLHGLVYVLYAEGAYHLGCGRWSEVLRLGEADLPLAAELGDPQESETVLTVIGQARFFAGNYEESERIFREVLASSRRRSNRQHEAWGLCLIGRCWVYQGRFAEAIELLGECRQVLEGQFDQTTEIICNGLLAVAHDRLGELERAHAIADETDGWLEQNAPTVFATVDGYAAVAEIYLERWRSERNSGGADLDERDRLAERALARLRKFAFVLPMGRPRSFLLQARRSAIAGERKRALALAGKSLAESVRLSMPFEEALSHLELSRIAGGGTDLGRHHLAVADRGFGALGATLHAASLNRSDT